jgi:hypothetical protein
LLVCEAKNTDLSFHTDLGPEHAFKTSQKARGQAARKAEWVRDHWRQLAVALSPGTEDPMVIALTVPRTAAQPVGGPGPASVPLPELAAVVTDLGAVEPAQWRPDLAAALL